MRTFSGREFDSRRLHQTNAQTSGLQRFVHFFCLFYPCLFLYIPYEVGPYAIGGTSFVLTFEELGALLKK